LAGQVGSRQNREDPASLLEGYLAFASTTSFITGPGYAKELKRTSEEETYSISLHSILRKDGSVGATSWHTYCLRRMVEDPAHLDML
jgi:hypothetical protein